MANFVDCEKCQDFGFLQHDHFSKEITACCSCDRGLVSAKAHPGMKIVPLFAKQGFVSWNRSLFKPRRDRSFWEIQEWWNEVLKESLAYWKNEKQEGADVERRPYKE